MKLKTAVSEHGVTNRTKADVVSSLLPPALFAGVNGSSLDSIQLSNDGKRLALLFETPSKGTHAPPSTHTQLLPGVLVYDLDADETLLLGMLHIQDLSSSCQCVQCVG